MRSGVGSVVAALMMLASACLPRPAMALESDATVKYALFDHTFADHRRTLYCHCPFDTDRRVDHQACGDINPTNSVRSRRIEVDHVMPASWIGRPATMKAAATQSPSDQRHRRSAQRVLVNPQLTRSD